MALLYAVSVNSKSNNSPQSQSHSNIVASVCLSKKKVNGKKEGERFSINCLGSKSV